MDKKRNIINTIIEYHIHNCIKEKLDLPSIRVHLGCVCPQRRLVFRMYKNESILFNTFKSNTIKYCERVIEEFPDLANKFQKQLDEANTKKNLEEFLNDESVKQDIRFYMLNCDMNREIEGSIVHRLPKIELKLKKTFRTHELNEEYIQKLIQDECDKIYNELWNKLYVSLIFIDDNKAKLDVSWGKPTQQHINFERVLPIKIE